MKFKQALYLYFDQFGSIRILMGHQARTLSVSDQDSRINIYEDFRVDIWILSGEED